jgi:hypothetical protein
MRLRLISKYLGSPFLLLLFMIGAAQARTDTLRCGNHLIEVGDTADKVREICGEPDSIDHDAKTFPNGGSLGGNCFHGTVPIETWTYDRGSTHFTAILTIADGKLVRISFAGVDQQPEIWSLGCTF